MRCSKVQPLLSAYIDKEIEKLDSDVEGHLKQCPECSSFLAQISWLKRNIKNTQGPRESLSKEEWERFDSLLLQKISQPFASASKTFTRYFMRVAAVFILATFIGGTLFFLLSSNGGVSLVIAERQFNPLTHKIVDVSPNVPPLPGGFDSDESKRFQLDANQVNILIERGFLATSRTYTSFTGLYRENKEKDFISYITADAVLSGFDHIISRLIEDVELHLVNNMNEFFRELEISLDDLKTSLPEETIDEQEKAKAIVAFGKNLSGLAFNSTKSVDALVEAEIKLINESKEKTNSPILGYPIDYSRFRASPSKNPKIQQYHKLLTWYSMAILRCSEIKDIRVSLIILISALNNARVIRLWEDINLTLNLIFGKGDDPGLDVLLKAAREVYGKRLRFKDILDSESIRILGKKILEVHKSKILSTSTHEPGISLFSARYSQRAHLLQCMVYPNVGTKEHPRLFPSFLDLAIVLGSKKALDVAKERGDMDFEGASVSLEPFRTAAKKGYQFTGKEPLWESPGLDGLAWLYSPLIEEERAGFPQFTLSSSWKARKLTSITGGLAEAPVGGPCFTCQEKPKALAGIIDPYPEFYNRLRTLSKCWEETLIAINYPPKSPCLRELHLYIDVLGKLTDSSRNFLDGKPVLDQDQLAVGEFILGWQGEETSDASLTDVYTLYLPSGKARYLHVGIGDVQEILVLIPFEGKTRVARGGIYTFYEPVMSERVTTEMWRNYKTRPGAAEWEKEYTVK